MFGLAPLCVLAADSPAQAKAREALRQKIGELDGQPVVTQPQPAASPTAATQPWTPAVAASATATPVDSAAVEKARQQMRQKMMELGDQEAVSQPMAVEAEPAMPAVAPAPAPTQAVTEPVVVPAPAAAPAEQPSGMVTVADPAAVEKAREALRQKMMELGGQEAVSQPMAVGAEPAAPGVAPASAAQPSGVATATDSAAAEKAREQLREKMTELEAQEAGFGPQKAVAGKQAVEWPSTQVPPPSDSDQVRRAMEQMHQKMAEFETQEVVEAPVPAPTAAPAAIVKKTASPEEAKAGKAEAEAARKAAQQRKAEEKARVKAEAEAKAAAEKQAKAEAEAKAAAEKQARMEAEARQEAEKQPMKQATTKALVVQPASAYKPLEAPALPISAVKQHRLAELLAKYKADQITPEEYHRERAKILAEP